MIIWLKFEELIDLFIECCWGFVFCVFEDVDFKLFDIVEVVLVGGLI